MPYDYLVIATGVEPRPDQTPGMLDPDLWRRSIFDFYTYDGAIALADALPAFDGGRLVVHIVDMPIKCPVAPLEFTFLADAWLRERGLRRPGGARLRDPAAGRRSPSRSRRPGWARCWTNARSLVEPDFLVERIDGTEPGLLRRPEDPASTCW